jgi:DNA-binding transcriptional regulator PaaX
LDYNQLKLAILRLLSDTGSLDSGDLAKKLESNGILLEIHALRMALMRYYKQGLLKRERHGGVLIYSLSERGLQRLHWLKQQTRQ